MSIKRCIKLAKKINECREKGLHPKVIRRLERKLDGATLHQMYPNQADKVHSIFQSARETLLSIIDKTLEVVEDSAKVTPASGQLSMFQSKSPIKLPIDGTKITQYDVLINIRALVFNFTKINLHFHPNVMLLGGMLYAFNNEGYAILGITKKDVWLDGYFAKCGLLADKLQEIVLTMVGD